SILISIDRLHRGLLRCICTSCLDLFTDDALENSIACWQWVLSARHDLTLPFMQEMIASWQESVDRHIGLFEKQVEEVDPLAAYEGCKLEPKAPNVGPHDIWIKFICERIEIAKYDSDAQVAMFAGLFHRTLNMTVGSQESKINRHIGAIGTRFRLLSCCLTLIQGDALPKSLSKNVLRERIYSACLDYFCSARSYPTQRPAQLQEDVNALLNFWNSLHADKKYLKTSHIGDFSSYQYSGGATLSPSIASDLRSTSGEFVMTNTGWINTVPLSSNTSTLSKRSSRSKRLVNPDIYVKDYLKKRALILSLLAVEIQRLKVWLQPPRPTGTGGEVTTPQEEALVKWLSGSFNSGKAWSGNTNLAWSIAPALAVYLPTRNRCIHRLDKDLVLLTVCKPIITLWLNDAIKLLLLTFHVLEFNQELNYMLTWAAVPPVKALAYFSRQYPPHPITAQYAVRVLSHYPSDTVLFYIPQLAQSLRYDTMGYVAEYIKVSGKRSQLLMHQLIWNMETNKYRDEDALEKDDQTHTVMRKMTIVLSADRSQPLNIIWERQAVHSAKLTNIIPIILRQQYCLTGKSVSKLEAVHSRLLNMLFYLFYMPDNCLKVRAQMASAGKSQCLKSPNGKRRQITMFEWKIIMFEGKSLSLIIRAWQITMFEGQNPNGKRRAIQVMIYKAIF
ncbi:unnamed protein product, partial [Meganyctiphanes norvegica]